MNAYYQTEEWKALRGKAIARADGKCELCGKKAVTAHHVRYPKGGYANDAIENLVATCWPCHEKLHGIRKKWHSDGDAEVDAILSKHNATNVALRNELCEHVVRREEAQAKDVPTWLWEYDILTEDQCKAAEKVVDWAFNPPEPPK